MLRSFATVCDSQNRENEKSPCAIVIYMRKKNNNKIKSGLIGEPQRKAGKLTEEENDFFYIDTQFLQICVTRAIVKVKIR